MTEIVRICTRPSVDQIFKGQMNLDDLLDAAISILLDGPYALLFLGIRTSSKASKMNSSVVVLTESAEWQ